MPTDAPAQAVLPRGCGVALVTPFDAAGRLDAEALARMVEHVVGGGAAFVVVLGTTGEAVSQSREECLAVLRRVRRLVAGRVPLVAGPFGANSTASLTERFAAYAEALEGYAAVMSSVPSYVKPNQEGIYRHFMALAEVAPLPILLYNVPGRTGVHMTAATTVRLARASDRFCGVKEASGNLVEGQRILRDRPRRDFLVYSGDDPTAMALCACGADGAISVVGNAYPALFGEAIDGALEGRLAAARRANDALLDVHPLLYVDGNPAGIKAVLARLGLCGPAVRLPLAEVSEATEAALGRAVLQLEAARAPALA